MPRLNYNKGRLSGKLREQEYRSRAKTRDKLRKRDATPAQLELMKKLDIEFPKKCSVEKACYLIGLVLNK